jgi:hypothetical protein
MMAAQIKLPKLQRLSVTPVSSPSVRCHTTFGPHIIVHLPDTVKIDILIPFPRPYLLMVAILSLQSGIAKRLAVRAAEQC